MSKKNTVEELGGILHDSHPYTYIINIIGISGLGIGIVIFYFGIIYDHVLLIFSGILTLISFPFIAVISILSYIKSCFRIFEHGILISAIRFSKDPGENLFGDINIGTRAARFDEVKSIHPLVICIGKDGYLMGNSIGLQFVLPTEKQGQIAGRVTFMGKEMKDAPEKIQLLKTQMGSLWSEKYRKDKPLSFGEVDKNKIHLWVELGEPPVKK